MRVPVAVWQPCGLLYTCYLLTPKPCMLKFSTGVCIGTPTRVSRFKTHTRLTALFPGLPSWAGTRKVKPIWILLKQEIVSGSGISWAICKSARRSRQITTPAPHHSVFFTNRMPFLQPNQQRQSTEGKNGRKYVHNKWSKGQFVLLTKKRFWTLFGAVWRSPGAISPPQFLCDVSLWSGTYIQRLVQIRSDLVLVIQ